MGGIINLGRAFDKPSSIFCHTARCFEQYSGGVSSASQMQVGVRYPLRVGGLAQLLDHWAFARLYNRLWYFGTLVLWYWQYLQRSSTKIVIKLAICHLPIKSTYHHWRRVGVPVAPVARVRDTRGVLYGTELGSVTRALKRVGLFCFPIKHSTHTLLFSN